MPSEAGQPTAPPPPGGGRIQIQWDDLNTRRVDQRLREQAALERNRRQAAMDPLSATTSALAAEDAAAGRPIAADGTAAPRRGLVHHPAVLLAMFGLLGGLLAWGAGFGLQQAQPDLKAEAVAHMQTYRDYAERARNGQMSGEDATRGIASLQQAYGDNPYFAVEADPHLSDADRDARFAAVDRQLWPRRFVANLLTFGLSGMLIAACLSIAEPLAAGNRPAAAVNAVVGATAGLAGGVVVALFVQQLYDALAAGAVGTDAETVNPRRVLAYAVSWGVLGLFLTVGPGLVMRNAKRLTIGLLGGVLGGLIGGAAFEPIFLASNANVSRGVALVLIGVVAGLFTGLIEHAARTGWLRVTAGLIAGKQFILYRNPTFIGSGPECPIYLFRDPAVGRRHAAVHAVPGGFEVENLPLGQDTLVNGRPVARARLRNGDELQVGATRFRFQEKVKASAK